MKQPMQFVPDYIGPLLAACSVAVAGLAEISIGA